MRLATPLGFPTEIHVLDAPSPDPLPPGRWVLVGDVAVQEAWRAAGMPEPEGTLWVPAREEEKRLGTLLPWLERWAEVPLHRDATVVAVGGGVLTDMAGLAAALYMRGIAWQSWPTTLLSQVDAGLGGKTGVDLAAGKNLAGAFHAPKRLVACTGFLETLPKRQLESGRWELVKTALILGDLRWAEEMLLTDAINILWIERALSYKAEVVHRDPKETQERRLLNLGHTLGHALESASGYQLLHGEAVGLGLLAACVMTERQELHPFPGHFIEALASRLAPLAPHIAPWEDCLPWLRRDKKGVSSLRPGAGMEINCILPRPDGGAIQRALPPEAWEEPHARLLQLLAQEAPRA